MENRITLCAFADEADKMIVNQIKALRENDMSLLEIRGVDGTNIADITLDKAKELKELFDKNNVKVWSIGSPIGKCKITDDFSIELNRFKHVLEVAKILGAENIRMFSFYGTNGEESYENEVISRLKEFVALAKDTNITLCHENEKDIFGEQAENCLKIHEAIPELKAVFDPANFVQANVDPIKAWDMLKSYVKYLHIKDADETHKNVVAGDGIGQLGEIMKNFASQGGGVATLEPHLVSFVGLKALEEDGKTDKNVGAISFANDREAFDTDVKAVRNIMADKEIKEYIKVKIGAQLYTVREYMQTKKDLKATLKKIADIGYKYVQVSGTRKYTGRLMDKQLKKYGLVCPLTHYSPDLIYNKTEKTIKKHKRFGCDHIGIGYAPLDSKENFSAFYEKAYPAALKIKENGMQLMYHNHNFEFENYCGDEYIMDVLCREFAPEELGVTLDVYWAKFAGRDPSEEILKIGKRISCAHLKDLVENEDGTKRFGYVGEGVLDFDKIIECLEAVGTKYAFVEQDDCYGADPFECLKKSYDYLKSKGYDI
jgi:sugar phosphate isomerase/epimerase